MNEVYRLIPAEPHHMEAVYRIIDDRIRWMDRVGILQWNTTDYWGVYPKEHYLRLARQGDLFVLTQGQRVLGVGALLREDPRWEDGFRVSAYYLHHFATVLDEKGIGATMLTLLEAYTKATGKERLRLDCAVDNGFLNRYYGEKGYTMCGRCVDGLYEGNLREKFV